MQSLLWMVLKSWWGLGVEKLFSSKTKTFKESSANLYISDLKAFRKAIEGLYWKIYLVGRKGIRVFCLKLLETFWSVIHKSRAFQDNSWCAECPKWSDWARTFTAQWTYHLSPQRIQLTLEKVSQNCIPVVWKMRVGWKHTCISHIFRSVHFLIIKEE